MKTETAKTFSVSKVLEDGRIKQCIKNSINKFSKNQKLEVQFQGILFSGFLRSEGFPLLEDKRNNNCDISIGKNFIELKYQFEFDILKLLRFYQKNSNKKLAESIEKDIKNSTEFVMFILEREDDYLKNECIYKQDGINFRKNRVATKIIKEYLRYLKEKHKEKDLLFTESYIKDDGQWKLHLMSVLNKETKGQCY